MGAAAGSRLSAPGPDSRLTAIGLWGFGNGGWGLGTRDLRLEGSREEWKWLGVDTRTMLHGKWPWT